MKSKIGTLIFCLLGVIVVLYYVPWIQKIDENLEGVQCRIGEDRCEEKVSITIEGTYKRYLLKENRFTGNISVSGYEFAKGYVEVVVSDGSGYLNYLGSENGAANIESLGPILFSNGFKEVLILVCEPVDANGKSWSGDQGLYIAANADHHDAALVLAKKLSKNSQWLANMEWK